MKKILILGAGRSSPALIKYLLDHAKDNSWIVVVADCKLEIAKEKTGDHPKAEAIEFDINDSTSRKKLFSSCDLIISLLPPNLHIIAARECLAANKSLITASYVSPELEKLSDDVKKQGLLFLNECGLDPGIDHMSAVQLINKIKDQGGEISSFRSYTGGLISPESSDNPWGYKFTWNPRNVILAGQSTARYLKNGLLHYTPYQRLFKQTEKINIDHSTTFEGYANRDSLTYKNHYGLQNTSTLIRGTLRNNGFCKAWDVFISIGLTDDSFVINDSNKYTYAELVRSFMPDKYLNVALIDAVADLCNVSVDSDIMNMIKWTGIFDDNKIITPSGSPAKILQDLLEPMWRLRSTDIDMIVMNHEFEFLLNGSQQNLSSSLIVKGDNAIHTAMAKTVGLPMAISAKLFLQNKLQTTGVVIPVIPEIYNPVLKELSDFGIKFKEKE